MTRTELETSSLDEAVAVWLVRHDAGLSPAEDAEFLSWLEESPGHPEAWGEAMAIWALVDDDAILREALRRDALAARPKRPIWIYSGAVAACACLILAIGLWTWMKSDRPGTATIAANAPATYQTGIGQRTVQLADGSPLTLDAGSAVSVALSPTRRDLRVLRGQAFFKVHHDTARPFVVAAGDRTVTATGTAFAVSLDGGRMAVVLESGRVAVTSASAVVTLTPGQRYAAREAGEPIVTNVAVDRLLAWRTGYLDFDDTPLSEALVEINRHAAKPVRAANGVVGALRISGRFHSGDSVGFTEAVAALHGLRADRAADGSIILRPESGR